MSAPEFNPDLLDDLVLALLWFNGSETRFGGHSAWKSLPWEALDRLHADGRISEPRRKSYSVTLDDEAWQRGQAGTRGSGSFVLRGLMDEALFC